VVDWKERSSSRRICCTTIITLRNHSVPGGEEARGQVLQSRVIARPDPSYSTEDLNGNQILDTGEDGNGDGVLDRDTGLFRIELAAGAKNLRLIVDGFVPGTLQTSFQVVLIDPAGIGSGTLVISDGAGNKVEKPILLSTKPLLTKVRVVRS
jgi:hypothetical protein